jgi:hypothetical protein
MLPFSPNHSTTSFGLIATLLRPFTKYQSKRDLFRERKKISEVADGNNGF